MNTAKKIQQMLKENTGSHFLDSGGAYGRHWERNQARQFENEPGYTIELDEYGFIFSRNVYWFLVEHLDCNDDTNKLNRQFNAFSQARPDSSWLQIVDEFLKDYIKADGLYGDGEPFSFNTYNGECNLSQTLQGYWFELDGCSYVALQIHQGCDVRGGYTKPHIFKAEETFLMFADGYIHFTDGSFISTDDDYHWYIDGCYSGSETIIEPVEGEPAENPQKIKVNGEVKTIGPTAEIYKHQTQFNF